MLISQCVWSQVSVLPSHSLGAGDSCWGQLGARAVLPTPPRSWQGKEGGKRDKTPVCALGEPRQQWALCVLWESPVSSGPSVYPGRAQTAVGPMCALGEPSQQWDLCVPWESPDSSGTVTCRVAPDGFGMPLTLGTSQEASEQEMLS